MLQDEIMFIKALGKHTQKRADHTEMVLAYTNALRKRANWGELDPKRVYAALQRELTPA
jgi:hypothetical protein